MTSPRLPSAILATLFAVLCAAPAGAQVLLQNDGFVSGQTAFFQGGFSIGEIAASRLVPPGPGVWRVNHVIFLFGGDTVTQSVTLKIWDDAAGTTDPGTELFSGDYILDSSNSAFQDIDLIADNVVVTGQFRVGLQFQHAGFPSVARDDDGGIQPAKNFIYSLAPLTGWFTSEFYAVAGDWILRAEVEEISGGGGPPTDEPQILSIDDVGNDQGKQVRVRFQRSDQDQMGATTPITNYEVYRRVDPLPVSLAGLNGGSMERRVFPAAVLLDGWDYVASVPAHGDSVYGVVVPTLADSSISQGLHMSVFFIRAATGAPLTYFDSAPDSGYSVDNLPPAPPMAFAASYSAGNTQLTWDPSGEADLWYYALHRGGTADFIPGPGNLIATTSSPGYEDVGETGNYYKLAAVDVNGNVSGYVLANPPTTGVEDDGTLAFSLRLLGPNPSRDGRLHLGLTLPTADAARLDVLDVSGRRVLSRDIGSLGAGRHTLDLSAGASLPSGIYLVRLRQGTSDRVVRAAVLE